jgi:AraC-like DNA-binding protein/PAS domain-containing protein
MHSLLAFPDSGVLKRRPLRRDASPVLRLMPGHGKITLITSVPPCSTEATGRESPREFQRAFFERLGDQHQCRQLFEHLPDVEYFAKDAEGRFVAMGSGTLRRIGVAQEEDILGLADTDIHPPQVARAIREDDLQVMRTGQPIVDQVEALYARSRAKDWYLTTKLPMKDRQGNVIGVMGFVRQYRGGAGSATDDVQIQRVVAHVHAHYSERLAISDLARLAHLSPRHLNRRFQETFRTSVQEFIVRTRIQASCDELLTTDKPIAEIAVCHGFYDQSAFTRHFHKQVGETPRVYRRRRK